MRRTGSKSQDGGHHHGNESVFSLAGVTPGFCSKHKRIPKTHLPASEQDTWSSSQFGEEFTNRQEPKVISKISDSRFAL